MAPAHCNGARNGLIAPCSPFNSIEVVCGETRSVWQEWAQVETKDTHTLQRQFLSLISGHVSATEQALSNHYLWPSVGESVGPWRASARAFTHPLIAHRLAHWRCIRKPCPLKAKQPPYNNQKFYRQNTRFHFRDTITNWIFSPPFFAF